MRSSPAANRQTKPFSMPVPVESTPNRRSLLVGNRKVIGGQHLPACRGVSGADTSPLAREVGAKRRGGGRGQHPPACRGGGAGRGGGGGGASERLQRTLNTLASRASKERRPCIACAR